VGYPIYQNEIATQKIIVETAVQRQIQNKIQEATFFIESPIPAVTLLLENGKLPYHIMAGAFRDEENAQRILDDLIKKGYNAKRIERNEHGLYPVLYGSFTTYAEAEKMKNEIRAKENPQAWILIESL
jgi:cell division protein FtsN